MVFYEAYPLFGICFYCEIQLKEDCERLKKNPLFKLSFSKLVER